ncbi:histidine phosphatase family protein [Chloroflexota bacterium]
MSRLLLIRHGETNMNSSFRYWGSTDVVLSDLGLRQAEHLRNRLKSERINVVYSSDLKRSLDTARVIVSSHNLEVITCPELREIDFGQIEGMTFEEVNLSYPEVARMWIERDDNLVYPGGESLAQLDKRLQRFRTRLEKHTSEDTILVVGHSGALRTLLCQLLGMESGRRWQISLDLSSLSIIETYPEGVILTLLNDVSHLTEKG